MLERDSFNIHQLSTDTGRFARLVGNLKICKALHGTPFRREPVKES